jgi:hypothetical protein
MRSPKSLHNLQYDEEGNYMAETERNINFGAFYRNVPKQTARVEQKKSKEILIE